MAGWPVELYVMKHLIGIEIEESDKLCVAPKAVQGAGGGKNVGWIRIRFCVCVLVSNGATRDS